jgi:hypothetical protein
MSPVRTPPQSIVDPDPTTFVAVLAAMSQIRIAGAGSSQRIVGAALDASEPLA